jgi:hypothetical protein
VKRQFVGLEIKRPGGKQSEHQISFQKRLEAAGGKYTLAYSLDDVIEFYSAQYYDSNRAKLATVRSFLSRVRITRSVPMSFENPFDVWLQIHRSSRH